MSTLTLVRHGQARPFQQMSDRLSPIGEEQSRKLGEWWVRRQVLFDRVYTGALVRQTQTAAFVGMCYSEAGLPWPSVQVLEELNEYDVQGILNSLVPEMDAGQPGFGDLLRSFQHSAGQPDRNRRFQRMFEAVMTRWIEDAQGRPEVESWRAFRARVRSAIRKITGDANSGSRVAAFTSGGPIGAAVQFVLEAPDRAALEVNWRVRNCSLTEFVYTRGRMSLDQFNAVPHLDDPSLWTYR